MSCSLFTKPPASCCGMLTNQETKYSQSLNAYGAPVTQNVQQRLALNASYAGLTKPNYSGNTEKSPIYFTPSRIPREYGLNERQLSYKKRTPTDYESDKGQLSTPQVKENRLEAEIIDIKEINNLEREIHNLKSLKEAA